MTAILYPTSPLCGVCRRPMIRIGRTVACLWCDMAARWASVRASDVPSVRAAVTAALKATG